MTRPIATFTVTPSLPPRLAALRAVADNLRWTWDHDAVALFRRLDPDLWEATGHNPVLLLGRVDQAQLEAAAADAGFVAHLERVHRALTAYLDDRSTWYARTHAGPAGDAHLDGTAPNGMAPNGMAPNGLPPAGDVPPGAAAGPLVAYCSAEFGLTESLAIFAGGLGVLAGDHLKSASDLGVPLVGLGLLYRQGYFRQHLTAAGRQHETYEPNDFDNLPLALERGADGAPVTVALDFPGRIVFAQVWRAQVGRVPLYLLDTDVPANLSADRGITNQLYGGDVETRLQQELVLGVGGGRALEALGIRPAVWHLNEGHAAFLGLERVRRLMADHALTFAEARTLASAGLVFTTHTPVPAGHDRFPPALMARYFGAYAEALGLAWDEFLRLGQEDAARADEPFTMTVLALRLAARRNAVSRLHGAVTRQMWQGLWPGLPVDEVPIGHVTNGVHVQSWIGAETNDLYERYLGPRWREEPGDAGVWRAVTRIPDDELWRTHERRRERLVTFARGRLRAQRAARGASAAERDAADEVLDPSALTLAFARRFATYKRATLLFRDPDRLARLLNDPARPVQIVVAGKAHPRDEAGKELIRQIVALSWEERFRRRVVFLEDYDMAVTRPLAQGADVWLNTPVVGQEASGTSGMKAAASGALNLSTRDGWWAEAWADGDPEAAPVGWVIDGGAGAAGGPDADALEAEALYHLLERDVVPTFYTRGDDGLPRAWIARVKSATRQLCPVFTTHRMVREYTERYYVPALAEVGRLGAHEAAAARAAAAWEARVRAAWPEVAVELVEAPPLAALPVGSEVRVRAQIRLGDLRPDDVRAELYLGRLAGDGTIVDAGVTPLPVVRTLGDGRVLVAGGGVPCHRGGAHGFTVRVVPAPAGVADGTTSSPLPGLVAWAHERDAAPLRSSAS